MSQKLQQTRMLWFLFVSTILVTGMFAVLMDYYQMQFIDSMSEPDVVRATIAGFSPEQVTVHIWVTAVLDVIYPLVYGALFIGVALRFFPKAGVWIALPGLIVIPVDLAEGVVQVLALTDSVDLIDLKAILTPLKTNLFIVALLIAIAGWLKWLYLKIRG